MRADRLDPIVPHIEFGEAGEVTTEVTIQLNDRISLKVEYKQLLIGVALEPESVGNMCKASIFED